MSRLLSAALLSAVVIATGATSAFAAQQPSSRGLAITVQKGSLAGESMAIKLRLPAGVAAVDGRVLFDTGLAEVVGVAQTGRGTPLSPQQIPGGVAFGAYGMAASGGSTVLNVVLSPLAEGQIPFRVVIDAVADASGARVSLTQAKGSGVLIVGNGSARGSAARDVARALPSRGGWGVRDMFRDGAIGKLDLDVLRAAWESSRAGGQACATSSQSADANGDGCTDIVDLQAVLAQQGHRAVNGLATTDLAKETRGDERLTRSTDSATSRSALAAATEAVWVVTSVVDTQDANAGNGSCADAQGRCTLRAAIAEANWHQGPDRITFNLAGNAPATIQMNSNLSEMLIQDRTGGVTIDGYSQPGSRVNTAAAGSNAIPGVELRGVGDHAFRVTSPGNYIRGFILNGHERAIILDGTDAHGNVIGGNWIGYNINGAAANYRGHYNIWVSNGAHDNAIGTPALADRNVSGVATKGLALYGPGTDNNLIQNNLFCETPSGTSTVPCDVGTDFTFGPKSNQIGGSAPGERNVYGPNTQQCIEFAHGINQTTSSTYLNNDNRILGNWLGFRADGSYDPAFRCGQRPINDQSNDSNGVNLADGSSYNLVEGNWIGSVWDGVLIMMPNETGNIVRNNTIGESPLGQAAPLGRYGVHVRTSTKDHIIQGNIIRNFAVYGVALTQKDVVRIRISRNIITDSNGQAIFLQPNANNPSTGANGLLASPQISLATNLRASGTGIAGSTVEVYRAGRPAGQRGLPLEYLGSALVANNGTWTAQITATAGNRVTALQINSKNNTSALGINVTVAQEQAGAPDVAADAFGRNVNNGWGNADTGGVYTVQGTAANYNVGNGTGSMQVPSAGGSRSALLTSPSSRDVDIKFRVSADQVGGGQYIVYGVGRRNGTNEYRARLIFNANGTLSVHGSRLINGTESSLGAVVVVPGLTQSANGFIWVHAQMTGTSPTTVRVNAWADGQSEPAGWQFSATDSQASVQVAGGVGLRAWLNSAVTTAPVTFRFDDYSVATAN